jgi:rare lipoprotein A
MRRLVLVVLLAIAVGCGAPAKKSSSGGGRRPSSSIRNEVGSTQRGKATWYGGRHHGGPTASGERFDKNAMTAAHKTLPMNTRVRVTHAKTGRSVTVRINDRGPYGKGRIIDVSEAAATRLGILDEGVAPVVVEVVTPGKRKAKKAKSK